MRSRKSRLAVIVDILTHQTISCQDELSKQLALKGFIVTQATLSRDLKKLKTTKVANDLGGYRYVIQPLSQQEDVPDMAMPPQIMTMQSALHPAALSLRISGNMLVIKTRNGYASGLAYDLDMLRSPLFLGTIPGADTVLAVVDEKAPRSEILAELSNFLPSEVIEEARKYFV